MQTKFKIILLSTFASLSFLALNIVKLDKQGLYYDEVFQATASFAYIGQPPFQFSVLEFRGIPLMNMNYIGAIKTAIYGLYLRSLGASFSVISWRLVGLISVSIALFVFGLIAGKKLRLLPLFIFYFLLITDITFLLTTRFDWGPVALSMSFRLVMIAFWLAGELSDSIHPGNSFLIGMLFGISLFEKLSAVVLTIPVLVMMLSSAKRRNARHIMMFLLGGLIGSFPLLFVNLYSFYKKNYFISLQNQAVFYSRAHTINDFLPFANNYFSLGAGGQVKSLILGSNQPVLSTLEIIQIIVIILIVISITCSHLKTNSFRLSAIMLFCFFVILPSLYFLPTRIWVHHWVIGTPFQYAAMSLLVFGMQTENIPAKRLFLKQALIAFLILFFTIRLFGVVLLEQAYLRGDSAGMWRPSYTKIGEFAAEKSKDAIFITGDWGVANQIICFVNGEAGIVYQVLWSEENIDEILNIARNTRAAEIYFVFPDPLVFTKPEARESGLSKIEQALAQQWHEAALDNQLKGLDALIIVRFQRNDD